MYILYIYIYIHRRIDIRRVVVRCTRVERLYMTLYYIYLYRGAIENLNRFVGGRPTGTGTDTLHTLHTHTHVHIHVTCVYHIYLRRYNILSKDFYDHRRPKVKAGHLHAFGAGRRAKKFLFFPRSFRSFEIQTHQYVMGLAARGIVHRYM